MITARTDGSVTFTAKSRRWFWVVITVACVALLWAHAWQIAHFQRTRADFAAAQRLIRQASDEAEKRVEAIVYDANSKYPANDYPFSVTRAELEGLLNHGAKFAIVRSDGEFDETRWTDPGSGHAFEFTFDGQRLLHFNVLPIPGPKVPPPTWF